MRNRLIHILILLLFVVACSKEQEMPSRNDDEKSYLNITTRTGDTDNNFAEGSTIRFAVYDSETKDIHLVENLNYVYAERSSNRWLYSYDEGKTKNESFGFLKNKVDTIDIVGVYPYIKDQDLSKVEIITNDTLMQKPYMWATSKKLSIASDNINVSLDFKHIMSALYLDMKLKNRDDGVIVSYITLKILNKEGNPRAIIPSKAFIDFTTGEINVDKESLESGIFFTIQKTFLPGKDGNYEMKQYFYIPPFDDMAADDKLEISFVINGKATTTKAISITGDKLGGGMARGARYTLPIEIGNYLKFSGAITKETQWTDAETIYVEY